MPPIIFLTVDSLRRDAVDTFDEHRGLTPNLEDLATDGVVFETAITNAPNTDQSFRAALTSLYPNEPVPMNERPYLPHLLSKAGYTTAAVYDTPKLEAGGFDRGFDIHPEHGTDDAASTGEQPTITDRLRSTARSTVSAITHRSNIAYELAKSFQFRASPPYVRADGINERAETALGDLDSDRLFMWVHYMDTHYPYLPTAEQRHRFGIEMSDWEMARRNVTIQQFISSDFTVDIDDDALEALRRLYRCQVNYVDRKIGELLDTLRTEGLYDDALIVVASDHGEEFLEHSHLGHSQHLYDELLRVPLLIKPPAGYDVADCVNGQVQYLELAPTILDVTGVETPETMRGTSLVSAMETGEAGDDPVVSEWDHHGDRVASVRTPDWKYIRDDLRGREELYDLTDDPGETSNCIQGSSEVVDHLQTHLGLLPEEDLQDEPIKGDQRRRRLRDLGYL